MEMKGENLCVCLHVSPRRVMGPSRLGLLLMLLLWGPHCFQAQDYEEDYEEEVVIPKKKNKLHSTNSIPQISKCESESSSLNWL